MIYSDIKVKTDQVDAVVIAKVLSLGEYKEPPAIGEKTNGVASREMLLNHPTPEELSQIRKLAI